LSGYSGNILRVNLTGKKAEAQVFEAETLRKYVGGVSLGSKVLFDEVPPEVKWSAPENRLYIGTGPLSGTSIPGSGGLAAVTKGALTEGAASTQANGIFGAYLRSAGFDCLILQGASSDWVYLHIHDGLTEFKSANFLKGKDNYEVDRLIKAELHKGDREVSILSIGPAGENLVRFACLFADMGHIAAHNGVGAVMGSKKLKAIVIDRGGTAAPVQDKGTLVEIVRELRGKLKANPFHTEVATWGTLAFFTGGKKMGILPVKNYSTSTYDISEAELEKYSAQSIRANFKEIKRKPCWGCNFHHSSLIEIPSGKYAGRIIEEPEYEGIAACGSVMGIKDVTTSLVLASEIDRLGMDANETGYTIAWLIECYEKGLITSKDTDGLELTWGNGDAVMSILPKIAHREGFGNILAEGVMRASRHIGGEAPDMAVHTLKGNTPRGHDHRASWLELFDTCVSNTGTLETHGAAPFQLLGLDAKYDRYSPLDISTVEARIKGAMIFEDSVITCRYNTMTDLELLCRAVNAVTGWNMDYREAMMVGKRSVNLFRIFNLRNGIGAELDAPSVRYGSTPTEGPAAGKSVMLHWQEMLQNYYKLMGWDEAGKPLPETLRSLGLDEDLLQLP
jgi:aldehyde:ferredoxin oxidoreductase